MGFITASGGEFVVTFEGNYLYTSDTVLLTLTGPTVTGVINIAYVSSIGKNGTTPWSFVIIAGSLPTGLSINAVTGAITGTPTVLGVYTFTVEVEDSLGAQMIQEFSITISSAANSKSGLYKLVPAQTHDTLYLDISVPTTQNVKIP